MAGAVTFPNAKYGQGIGEIYLDHVQCDGNESLLSECENDGVGVSSCSHAEDVGVRCQGTAIKRFIVRDSFRMKLFY